MTIDYVLADEKAFDSIRKMEIDEKREIDMKTGRNFIKIWTKWEERYTRTKIEMKSEKVFYSKKEEDLAEFARICVEEIEKQEPQSMELEQVEEIMKRVAEACLKRKGNGARNNRVKKHNKDIESMIKERRTLNKERKGRGQEGETMGRVHDEERGN